MISKDKQDQIDEAAEESFPTSDPPAWTLGTDQEEMLATVAEEYTLMRILMFEHQAIKRVLVMLDQNVLKSASIVDSHFLKNVIHFFREFVISCHHEKEKLLLPLLKSDENGLSAYLINDLNHEFELIEKIIIDIDVTNIELKDTKFFKQLQQLHDIYTSHMAKKIEYIIPIINKRISLSEQKNIAQQFEKLNNALGNGKYLSHLQFTESINSKK